MSRMKTEVKIDDLSSKEIRGIKKGFNGFLNFMNKQSIVALAIGVIIGQSTKDAVNVLVSGIITPAIQLLTPNAQLQDLVVKVGKAEFQVGLFLNTLIEMFIIMLILYITFGIVLKRKDLLETKKVRIASKAKTSTSTKKK